MTRTLTAVLLSVMLLSAFVVAQQAPSNLEVFGGYSLLHTDTGGVNGTSLDSLFSQTAGTFGVGSNPSGWNAEAQYNANRWLGAVADFSGNYWTPVTVSSGSGLTDMPRARSYSFLFGPVLSYRTPRLTPYVHALFGVNRLSTDASSALGLPSVSDSAFAAAFGGGVDMKLKRGIALRLGQLDYLYTRHDPTTLASSLFGSDQLANPSFHQNNVRFSTGVVFNFGK